eukprot:TRINITY_DN5030_c0_g1_i1.p1 TRINITY_DN5030_c0_g1~~TRINITY_DN5030_c0_g1_i1.p1  ORF type:complete len:102 (+),score=4.56 TRINITY_DN5030_c0_g1_i1:70-375(+)
MRLNLSAVISIFLQHGLCVATQPSRKHTTEAWSSFPCTLPVFFGATPRIGEFFCINARTSRVMSSQYCIRILTIYFGTSSTFVVSTLDNRCVIRATVYLNY